MIRDPFHESIIDNITCIIFECCISILELNGDTSLHQIGSAVDQVNHEAAIVPRLRSDDVTVRVQLQNLRVRQRSQILFEGNGCLDSLSGFPGSEGFGCGEVRLLARTLRQGNDRGREDEGPSEAQGGGGAGSAEPSRCSGTGKKRHGFLQYIHTPTIFRGLSSRTFHNITPCNKSQEVLKKSFNYFFVRTMTDILSLFS